MASKKAPAKGKAGAKAPASSRAKAISGRAKAKPKKTPAQSSKRTAPGRPFAPGKSGNPGGRPKLPEELKVAFRALAPEALTILQKIMRALKARPADRIKAAEVILNRGYGTPTQSVELTGKDGGPIEQMTHEQALARLAELRVKQDA